MRKHKRLGANIFWLVGDRSFRLLVGFVISGAIARYLGKAGFGAYSYASDIALILLPVATMGMEGIVIGELLKHPDKKNEVLGTALVLRFAGAALAVGLILIFARFDRSGPGVDGAAPASLWLIFVASLAFGPQAFDVIDLWFQKNVQSKFTVLAKGTALTLGAGFKIYLIARKASVTTFCWALVLDAGLGAVAQIITYTRRGELILRWRPRWEIARRILGLSWPLIFSGVLVAVCVKVEQILVKALLSPDVLGVYSAAVRLTSQWFFIPTLVLSTVYPLMVEKRGKGENNYRENMQTVFDLLTGAGYVIAAGATLLGPVLIRLVFGEKYVESVPILIVQAWSAPILFSASARAQYFLLENLNIYHIWAASVGLCVNVALGLFLVPVLGAKGAALSAMGSYWVSGYLTSWIFPRLRECGRMQTQAFLLPFRPAPLVRALLRKS